MDGTNNRGLLDQATFDTADVIAGTAVGSYPAKLLQDMFMTMTSLKELRSGHRLATTFAAATIGTHALTIAAALLLDD